MLTPRPGAQRGVGLIEILVTVVMLSIGFLAAAKMQIEGMRFSKSAYYRSQAYFLASDMLDRMRANPVGVNAGAYDEIDTAGDLADPGCGDAGAGCGPAALARQDRYEWSAQLHPLDGLPNFVPALGSAEAPASGSVRRLPGGQGIFEITLSWEETVGDEVLDQTLSMRLVSEAND